METNKTTESPPLPPPLPPTEHLLKKIHELELGHARLKQEMSNLMTSSTAQIKAHRRQHSVSPQRRKVDSSGSSPLRRETRSRHNNNNNNNNDDDDDGGGGRVAVKFTDNQLLNILQSMGQAIHTFDLDGTMIYWNRSAEILFGYSADEALGRNVMDLLCDPRDHGAASNIIRNCGMGQTWTGQFPIKHKNGNRFVIVVTDAPFLDDNGKVVGVICLSNDARLFKDGTVAVATERREMSSGFSRHKSIASLRLGLDPEQPLQTALASKFSGLASKVSNKVKSKMRSIDNFSGREGGGGDSHYSDREDASSSPSSTPRGDILPSPFGLFSTATHEENHRDSGDESESKPSISRIISTKAEAWMGRKGLVWPWKGNEWDGAARFVRPWIPIDEENSFREQITFATLRLDNQVTEANPTVNNEATDSWSPPVNVNSSSSSSSCGSTSSGPVYKAYIDSDSLDCEILWEDLTIGEQVGEGSCGTVYHALLYGSDVAVKVFSRQQYSEDLIFAFRQEVSLMKKLRHPNILLFMGAVTSLQRLCIVTEFLPRGSLFRLLHRKNATKLECKRRIHMALDIARGMNYLHRRNPPIVHRDLKSSNLLVDKNWTVKVGDFGLSRLKTQTYLTTKTGKGTPQWMAPEVLRNEPSDEKSDIYSYGVILWELVAQKIPWESLNSMQVIGAVGFMNQRLDIPNDIDPQWASIIESCWHDEPRSRPSFQELMVTLKDLQKKYVLQSQSARAGSIQKEL